MSTPTIREIVENRVEVASLPPSYRGIVDLVINDLEQREMALYDGEQPKAEGKGVKRKLLASIDQQVTGLRPRVEALEAFARSHGFSG